MITCILIDIGGVLLTNGWDTASRQHAAEKFGFDFAEVEKRHRFFFDLYEMGKVTLSEYVKWTVFYTKRSFGEAEFKEFMFAQSKPYEETIELFRRLKAKQGIKVGALNNEGKEMNDYRIEKFKLCEWIDFFVSSCSVHMRKPDPEIYKLALMLSQVKREKVLYVDDRELFVEMGTHLGIRSIRHVDYNTTANILDELNFG